MIAVSNRILVHPEFHELFEQRFAERESHLDDMDGFISFQILRPVKEDDPYVVMTVWENMEAFNNWTNSDQFRQQHSKQQLPPEAFLAKPKLEIAEIIQQQVKVAD
ncbi:MAG: antibiotic biosynthesis monooxygenase [Chloroflexi bacterium]|nr:antibiotic biosynthesis monooxygenase [Chloroflexota bacterium]